MTWVKENACSHCQTTKNPLMQDAEPGIGTIEFVFHAQVDGSSTIRKYALLFQTNALPMITLEAASLAIKDTISKKEPVSSQASTMLIPPTLDAEHGTGTIKFVFHAPKDGSLMTRRFVFPFLTNALQAMLMETALLAIKVMTLRVVPAFSLISTMLIPLTLDVEHGIGTIKSAFHAQVDGSSTIRKFAFPFQTNAKHTMMLEIVW
jgi:hypothetical protein